MSERAKEFQQSGLSVAEVEDLRERLAVAEQAAAASGARADELWRRLNNPIVEVFLEAVKVEAAHQVERWGSDHDAGKTPEDWLWLLGWLAGKAVHAAKSGDREKALHHTISSAAVLANWHAALQGMPTRMRPGINPFALGYSTDEEIAR